MSLFKIFDISGSGLSAQNVRLNVTASNISNAQSVAGTAAGAYKARNPVFAAMAILLQSILTKLMYPRLIYQI